VNGTWTHEDEQARVSLGEDAGDFKAGVEDGRYRRFGRWTFFFKKNRRQNDFGPFDTKVFGGVRH
jgi:hypothetical protein